MNRLIAFYTRHNTAVKVAGLLLALAAVVGWSWITK
jgi:hypothetical protein